MEAKEYYQYHLKITDGKISSIKLEDKEGKVVEVNTFEKPVTRKDLSKLYVVKHQSEIIYVGVTSQGIRDRLRYGLQAKGKHGYHGYHWKDLDEIDLLVWCFPEEPKRIESIEAELVYLVRNHTGQWPEYQTEIHFHKVTEEEKKVAESIYQETLK